MKSTYNLPELRKINRKCFQEKRTLFSLYIVVKKNILLLTFLILGLQANTQELVNSNTDNIEKSVDYLDLSLKELMAIKVVSPTLTKELYLNSPSTILVITDKMIKERGYYHIEEIFHDIPGFDINKVFGDEYATIFMRGLRTNNTDGFILLYDGIRQNDIWKKSLWISRQYPVNNIKRIEIMYGPSSALWGTHAFSGIVNIITKSPEEMGTNINISGGSYGSKNLEYNIGNKINNDISYNLSIKYFDSKRLHPWEAGKLKYPDNFSPSYKDALDSPMIYLDGQLREVDMNEEQASNNYGIHANVFIGKNLKLSMLNWVKNETDGYWFTPFQTSGKYSEWRIGQQAYKMEYTKNPSDKLVVKSTVDYRVHQLLPSRNITKQYYSAVDQSDLYNTATIKQNDISTYLFKYDPQFGFGKVEYFSLTAWDMSFKQQLNYTLNNKIKIYGDVFYSYTNTQQSYNRGITSQSMEESPRRNRKKLNSSLQLDYTPFINWRFILGAKYEETENDYVKGYEALIPRASFVYSKNDFSLRLQYAEAFREPSDAQLFSTSSFRPYPSPKLKPEKSKSIEAGASYFFRKKIFLSSAIYRSTVDDFIITNPALNNNPPAGTPGYINDDKKSKIYGYEFYSILTMSKTLSLQTGVSGAFNYRELQRVDANNELVVDSQNNPINDNNVLFGDIAPARVSMMLMYKWKDRITILPKMNYVSGIKTINHRLNPDITPIVPYVKGYTVFGLNVTYLNLLKDVDFNIKINNLFDKEYYNPGVRSAKGGTYHPKVLQPGINFMASLNYRLK